MKEKYWMMQMPYDENLMRQLQERFKPRRLIWRDIEMEKTNQIQQTLNERGKNYGSFDDVAACVKLARIFAGKNPSYEDNWRDIAGYAMLGGKLEG